MTRRYKDKLFFSMVLVRRFRMYIFAVLPDTGVAKDCEKAEESLNDYFATQVNVPFERH